MVAFAFGGTEIVSVAAAETAEPARSVKKAVRTVLWRILVFYIGAIFVIAAVVPVGSAGLKSPFAAVLDAAGMPSAATAITLVAVAALLSAWNANLYGASRMTYTLAERGEAPRWLASVSKSRVPVAAVLASVAFGVVTEVLELAFPEKVLPVLLNIVGSTSLIGAAPSAIVVIYNDAAYGAEIHHYGSQGLTEKPMLIPRVGLQRGCLGAGGRVRHYPVFVRPVRAARLDRRRRQGHLRGRLPDHLERPRPVDERVDEREPGSDGRGGWAAPYRSGEAISSMPVDCISDERRDALNGSIARRMPRQISCRCFAKAIVQLRP
ncbi:hypothetical protein NicSoilB11_10590 [Arthrobacter sp. NicSoilB11]|nr:hypothetical protein NicSoilB11_10590 [Arthrobacter sp. NicSoilB11]